MKYPTKDHAKALEEFINLHEAQSSAVPEEFASENERRSKQAVAKAKLVINQMYLNNEVITATTVAEKAGLSRSFLYKNPEIKELIQSYKEHNSEVKKMRTHAPDGSLEIPDDDYTHFQLYTKLMENYILEYQILDYENQKLENEIAEFREYIFHIFNCFYKQMPYLQGVKRMRQCCTS